MLSGVNIEKWYTQQPYRFSYSFFRTDLVLSVYFVAWPLHPQDWRTISILVSSFPPLSDLTVRMDNVSHLYRREDRHVWS